MELVENEVILLVYEIPVTSVKLRETNIPTLLIKGDIQVGVADTILLVVPKYSLPARANLCGW